MYSPGKLDYKLSYHNEYMHFWREMCNPFGILMKNGSSFQKSPPLDKFLTLNPQTKILFSQALQIC